MIKKSFDKQDKVSIVVASVLFAAAFLSIRLSGVSVSSVVNIQNYIAKTFIVSTAGMSTLQSVAFLLSPFLWVFVGMVLISLGIAVLTWRGYFGDTKRVGKFAGMISALAAIAIFPTLLGIFLAIGVFIVAYYSPRFSNMYSSEIKKWRRFRSGSRTAGRLLFVFNIVIAVGVFFSVLAGQAAYEESFKQELADSVKSIGTLVGAQNIQEDVLDQAIRESLDSSPLLSSYIRWLPVSSAFSTWIVLEVLRNLILANIVGASTYIATRRSE